MAVPEHDVVLPLPLEAVMQSAGFSMDIGGSVAKLVYRSKDEYTNGKPNNENEYKTGTGQVHLVQFRRENIQDVMMFLTEKCDVTQTDQFKEIHACGLGGNDYAKLLESAFNLKLSNSLEVNRFIEALCFLLEYKRSDIFHPQSQKEEGVGEAGALVEIAMHRHLKEGGKKSEYYSENGYVPTVEDPSGESHFPFLIAMMGSGFVLSKDFASLHKLVEESEMSTSESTVDTQYRDMVSEVLRYAPEVVDSIAENKDQLNFRCKTMDKLLWADKDIPKTCDIVHSVLETLSEFISHSTYYAARVSGVKKIYFVGNFIHPPIVRKWVTQNLIIRNRINRKEEAIDFRFVQNGGHMGALGAYLLPYLLQRESKEASTTTE